MIIVWVGWLTFVMPGIFAMVITRQVFILGLFVGCIYVWVRKHRLFFFVSSLNVEALVRIGCFTFASARPGQANSPPLGRTIRQKKSRETDPQVEYSGFRIGPIRIQYDRNPLMREQIQRSWTINYTKWPMQGCMDSSILMRRLWDCSSVVEDPLTPNIFDFRNMWDVRRVAKFHILSVESESEIVHWKVFFYIFW